MRNQDFNDSDAARVVSTLLDRIATTPPATAQAGAAQQRQMSIVEFTEELLRQVARNKRS
ncbi:hypothetical protein [Noviherbaspirillum aridicola]|uniref:Uncharacterized protein n=1 Tax=Noviherbaspirillum aridicola TaxID=2849687 RepID=A0ABQ4PZ31_9BURK|nr:hypothetical protein [Noviherbaspirillum aridicola]GIZ50057.1 hypothetical protein NCCP691_00710 [Noviherbaspirillum aridicola]